MKKKNKNEWAEYLFHQGTNYTSYDFLGSFLKDDKCIFRVWAPNAKKVFVTGEFCDWKPYEYEAKKINDNGLYECEIDGVKKFDAYKYVFISQDDRTIFKSDPYAKHFETRPKTASKVYNLEDYKWNDSKWMVERKKGSLTEKPMNIYEVHLGSWKLKENGDFYTYKELAKELVNYVKKMNYTHIELLPIAEHPYDKSWGYQVTGYFAPTSRFGLPEDFMYFVDECHKNNIGVILDWVPAHFPKDESGLCEFDGGYVYEYPEPLKMEHREWGTRIFDFGRNEVISFLISNAAYWLEKYHIDGLRVDAVSSMLYLNYNRDEWLPNIYGQDGNLEAIKFFKNLNKYIKENFKGAFTVAEESTAWSKITHSVEEDGLGFDFKWNMGWMNDSLKYHSQDPFFRKGVHNNMTFSMTYAFSEKFVLPLSHDEVVHGKKSILDRASVEFDKKFPSLRAFLGYMYAHPGKKLTFMGTEIAQVIEWNDERSLDWLLLDFPNHDNQQKFVKELNKVYLTTPSLWENDTHWEGFKWNVVDDSQNNVFGFTRFDKKGNEVLVVSNFSSQELKGYKIGVDRRIKYKILLNSDAKKFGGTGIINRNIESIEEEWNSFEFHIKLNIPPFSTMYLTNK